MLLANFVTDLFKETIGDFLVKLLLLFDSFVYSFVDWFYQIILILCNVNILENSQAVTDLIKRVYVILGVVMLFLIAYSLLKAMVNPNEAAKGKMSPVAIIKNVLISVVLIALIPTIFDFAFGLQSALLTQNTIGKIILGTTSSDLANEDSSTVISNGGRTLAAGVLLAFLHPDYSDEEVCSDESCSGLVIEGESFDEFWTNHVEGGSLTNITTLSENVVSGQMTYYFIISTIAGFYVAFVLLTYCKDVAVRAVKLSVFELIAPVTIFARMVPGEQGKKVFDNWIKATLSTFIEVFIRLALLFFSILIVKIVLQNFPEMFNAVSNGGASIVLRLIAQAFIIIGIVSFLKDAPNLIKEITGLDGGKYSKGLVKGLGALATPVGALALTGTRQFLADRKAGMSKGNAFKRAFGTGLNASKNALWKSRKMDKVSDMKKIMGAASSGALQQRADVDAKGGYKPYLAQKVTDKIEMAKMKISGLAEAYKGEQKVANLVLKVEEERKKIATEYVSKHESEFMVNASNELMTAVERAQKDSLQEVLNNAKQSGDQVAIQRANADLSSFNESLARKYTMALSLLNKKRVDDSLTAEEREAYEQAYNKGNKKTLDNFADEIFRKDENGEYIHDAHIERRKIETVTNNLQAIINENPSSRVVQYGTTQVGYDKFGKDSGLHDYSDGKEFNIETDRAAFFKVMKKAAENTNEDVQNDLDALQRLEERNKKPNDNNQ